MSGDRGGRSAFQTAAARDLPITRKAETLLVEVGDRDPDAASVRTDPGGKAVWARVPIRVFLLCP
ncbi:hypothetical protein SAMN05421837_12178 [Amycolatopsis pretoriensis]|uniref:Uncharacterized protein n=1 Tax=Amycolatopsis pretoriensis TaxID=218821 RepID=A0A1H5RLP2_9PSEU|nr:hypothetical protein [Amycolatopsis pretoriensis]SEF38447.1 hypothetical protein SAMN05421837_12178 [Amycolatopsis pretoriensis]